jgi:activating signal cointegrator complex subunit 2
VPYLLPPPLIASFLTLSSCMIHRQDDSAIFRDRSFIEEMKADILRRAEALSDDEETELIDPTAGHSVNEKGKGVDIAYDEELEVEGLSGVRVVGDGDESAGEGDGEDVNEEDGEAQGSGSTHRPTPETILGLAYIRDPKLFDRDAQTRRSKPRAELKAQTGAFNSQMTSAAHVDSPSVGWSDEQIEGWKIMLERNVSIHAASEPFFRPPI